MKKILTVLIITLMMTGLFAYEPNPEFFDVSDDMVSYYEEVEPQYGGNGIRCFLSTGPIGMKKEALLYYRMFESEKAMINMYFLSASSTDDEEIKEKNRNNAINCKKRAINEIPFITEKNFWKINEKQYIKIFCKYLKKIQKAELKKQKLSK